MHSEIYWEKALRQTKYAINKNSLVPLNTTLELVSESNNRQFEVRKLQGVITHNKQLTIGPRINPFLPPDENLVIDSILEKHILILNKYPVQRGHMLLITNSWEPQSSWLTIDDFYALKYVDNDTTGLWFFNSSPNAGASQPHKHIQLLRRDKKEIYCPRNNWFLSQLNQSSQHSSVISNSIKVLKLKKGIKSTPEELYHSYLELASLSEIGLPYQNIKPLLAYNLIVCNDWIALIKRRKESAMGFSINALGFAGYILATDESNFSWLINNGLEKLLEMVI